ncbi:ATP-binding cassette domain-containing protein [Candidatus Peregrinibacteria bacterium]|jgi:cell division transport system ATP-binding protein|nr:ATP-binding cassette domain-containing protein [Candidatus Peregrinibacteria bacterium]MBT7484511.1 ATP-binding cassette domain-containing protein [Candidatus Peregrinibacteria bacterium]MBT7702735.1 ATP-binding cassette domain-containing protein [Candidatus Peregrinibacteria bacterium]
MIQFENVIKKYGEHKVLDHVDLEVEGGEFVTLIGPSGAGKSTLLHALIGDLDIDSGSILVDGYEITQFKDSALQEYRRKVGMVFQDYKLLENKTVYENVAFALEVCGEPEEDIRERVYAVLDLVGMLDHEGKFPRQLAGGEGQRVAIARAMVHNPRLLIADEPTGNLDFWNTQEILKLLLKINDQGATVLLATHNRDLVDELNRRVVVLNEGRIVIDKPQSGYDVSMESAPVGEIEIFEIH